jgi:simple sugar transport system permease protein
MKRIVMRKLDLSVLGAIATPLAGVLVGVLVGSLVVVNRDRSLLMVLGQLAYGAFGSWSNFTASLVYAIPLGFCGLAIAMSYNAGIFNIGAEGQLQLAALATAFVATRISLPSPLLHVPLALLVGALVGAAWALLPGILKAYKGFNEIVVTMLLNYVAILFVSFALQGPMKDPKAYFPQSRPFPQSAWLQRILPTATLHYGFIVLLVMIVLAWFLLYRTTFGFRVRAVGLNPEASRYAGIAVERTMVLAMVLSGAMAGLAGSVEVMGVYRRIMEGFSPGYGYDAIAVALLANLNPLGVLFSAFFFGALRNAAGGLQVDFGIPVSFVFIIQALTIFFVIASQGLKRLFKKYARRCRHAA